jgi:demethylmenaquinone methyltransferase/2-methoxy-6-polyprenyl-1,4-benzoquinol methylase
MKPNRGKDQPAAPAEPRPADPAGRTLAQDLFDGVAHSYDTWAQVLTFFQYLRWREFLVSRMAVRPGKLVLDVCSGTAGVALEIVDHCDGQVVGLDVSRSMLQAGRRVVEKRGLDGRVQLTQGRAERLPFRDETFDTVVFTYLLRYVQDPGATIRELSRVLKRGGELLSLEFGIPEAPWMRALWELHNRVIMPVMTLPVSRSWHRMGCFLGPSISGFCKRYPVERLAALWRENGIPLVQSRRLLLGVAVVTSGTKQT